MLCAPLSSQGGSFREQRYEQFWYKLVFRCERTSALGLGSVWLQGAAVPWGSIAPAARTAQNLEFTFFFFTKLCEIGLSGHSRDEQISSALQTEV